MKRSICVFLALVLALGLSVSAFAAGENYIFSLFANDGTSATVEPGKPVTVTLVVTKTDGTTIDLYSMQDYLKFDPAYLRYESAKVMTDNSTGREVDVFNANLVNLTGSENRLFINRASTSALETDKNEITAVTVTFVALKEGTTKLTHDTVEMLDGNRNHASVTEKNATVTIQKSIEDDSGGGTGGTTGGGSTGGGSSSGGISGAATYPVTAPSSVTDGTVTVNPKNASEGSTVTITVEPGNGYILDALTVTDANGNRLSLTKQSDTQYTFTMPASKVNIEASFKEVQTPTPPTGFVDVPADSYYADAVAWAVANGITEGTSDTTFSPNASCTRAQMVTFLWRAAGCPEPTGTTNAFTDVVSGSYYEKAVQWAVEQGITKGTSDSTFSPEETVTRAQTVTFLHRYMSEPDGAGTVPFTDVAANSYYENAVQWAVDTGVTKGTSDTTFSPDNDCVRAQTVTFLYRALVK